MDKYDLKELIVASRLRQDALLKGKGGEYTRGDDDRLANFKRWARELEIEPLKVWMVYTGKHLDSLITFVKTGDEGMEGIQSRLDDLHNYLLLGEGLIQEYLEYMRKATAVTAPRRRRKK